MKMRAKFKLIIFTFLIGCFFIKCSNLKTENRNGSFREYSLHGQLYDKDIVMRPFGLFTLDSMLFIVSSGISDGFGQVFNLQNDLEELGVFGNIGNGPDEFISPELTFVGDNYFFMQNVNAREIAKWSVAKTDSQIKVSEISRLRLEHHDVSGIRTESRKVNPLGDEYFVGLICNPEEGYFTLYNKNMEFINSFGKPPIYESGMSPFSYMRRLSGHLSANGSSFVFSAMNIPYIAYYSMEKGDATPVLRWEDTYGKISYTAENDAFNFSDKAVGMTMGVQNRDEYIYVLYIDMPWNQIDFSFAEKSLAKSILVFNRKGERIARLNMDHGLYFFYVSEDEKTIYGITQNPDYMVVNYEIPEFQ